MAGTDTPVLGDLELMEIMKQVGEDIGVTPVTPKVKAKEEVKEEAKVPKDEPAPELESVEPEPLIEEPVVETPSLKDEVVDYDLGDPELEALLAGSSDGEIDLTPEPGALVDDGPLVKVTKATAEEEAGVETAIKTDGEIAVTVVPETELPKEVLEALEDTNEVETTAIKSKPVLEAPAPVETETRHPLAMDDDDDYEPIKRDGVVYYIDPARLKRDVAFSPHNIDDAMMTHASKFVHYAVQSSMARGQFERMKAAFEILESKLDGEHRTVLKEENPKTTEAQIRAAVVADARWKAANARLIETRTVYELAQDAKEAFTMRRDTLLQVAKNVREERGGEMRLKEIQEDHKATRGRVLEKLGKTA
jgi:hypothetical protein